MTHTAQPVLQVDDGRSIGPELPDRHKLIPGAGMMADRTRNYDWSATSLGAMETWSEGHLASVNLILTCEYACQLWWGPELIQFHNDKAAALIGERQEWAVGRPAQEVWGDAWPVVAQQLLAAKERGETTFLDSVRVPIVREGVLAETFWTYSYSPVYERGAVAGVLDVFQETTESVMATRQRNEFAGRLNEVLTATSDAIISMDREFRITYMNSQAEKMLAPDRNVLGTSFSETFPYTDYAGSPYGEHFRRALLEGIASEFQAYYPQPLYLWLNVNVRPSTDGIVVFVRDISEQRSAHISLQRTADALHASEEELRYTIELSSQIPWTADSDGHILGVGRRWMELTGRSGEQARGSGWTEAQHEDDRPRLVKAWQLALAGGEYDVEHRLQMADGTCRWMRSRAYPRRNDAGEVVKWYGTMEDIETRKQAELTLLMTEKLAAVGRLAASIAHEINNPLESVTNLLYLARTSEGLSSDLQGYLDMAERELRRVSAITSQTLRFHKQATSPQPVVCEDLIGSVLSMQQGRLVNSGVAVQKRKRATHPVLCFEGEIRQVMNNLIGNAIDALHPGGGRLLLRSREQTAWKTGERGLVLTVADTGPGIPQGMVEKIFEPFYTTKGIGGTGLGLWVSKEIVLRHRGALRMRSKVGSGTVFTLFLPFAAQEREGKSAVI